MARHTWIDELDDDELVIDAEDDETLHVSSLVPRQGKPRKQKKGKGTSRASTAGPIFPENDEAFPEHDNEIHELLERKAREKRRASISEPFKCRNCRAFIGEPPSGGRQRNHCPMCLYSLHVDDKTPGDRASECRSAMRPIGVFYRPNLEQMVVHECLGCGFIRYNRVAADDNVIFVSELPIVDQATIIRGEDAE